jgi:hypothetical protein
MSVFGAILGQWIGTPDPKVPHISSGSRLDWRRGTKPAIPIKFDTGVPFDGTDGGGHQLLLSGGKALVGGDVRREPVKLVR